MKKTEIRIYGSAKIQKWNIDNLLKQLRLQRAKFKIFYWLLEPTFLTIRMKTSKEEVKKLYNYLKLDNITENEKPIRVTLIWNYENSKSYKQDIKDFGKKAFEVFEEALTKVTLFGNYTKKQKKGKYNLCMSKLIHCILNSYGMDSYDELVWASQYTLTRAGMGQNFGIFSKKYGRELAFELKNKFNKK
jgi:hypothetical protein|tara:strand:- start:2985 stop:3551 length:567 start_codon:yes stop_codon:yes gene_type:complete